jgi:condensin complex subunit 2
MLSINTRNASFVTGKTHWFALQDVIEQAMMGASEGLLKDLTVHVCFICVLHLANEHGLYIIGDASLDQLVIRKNSMAV